MTIDWAVFTPWTALAGGVLIGIAAALFMLANGRILGVSSIVAGLIRPAPGDRTWRLAFVVGTLTAPLLYALFSTPVITAPDAGWGTVILGGLLVGAGTLCGSGCTSGHGVCGLSRLSLRSLVATLTFMVAGFVTVFIVRHVLA